MTRQLVMKGVSVVVDRMQILPIPCTEGTLPWQPLFAFRWTITSVVWYDS